jgi:hypothetical protein
MKISQNNSELIDQSIFTEEQAISQAPPDQIARKEYIKDHKVELGQKKRNTLFLFLGVVLIVSAIVAILLVDPAPQQEIILVPTPTNKPVDSSLLEKELLRLKEVVNEADPFTKPLIPPPVDMDVKL